VSLRDIKSAIISALLRLSVGPEQGGTTVPAVLIGNWWAMALRGGAAILFAAVAFTAPNLTATALIVLFGVYLLIDGIFAFVAAKRAVHRHGRSWPLIVEGMLDIALAAICFVLPGVALVALIYVIGFWALLSGVALVTAGFGLLRLNGHLLLVFGGALSIGLGVLLLAQPQVGVVALAWWLGAYTLVFGILLVSAAFRLRHHEILW
jgi:uncharacterized membrane protein HdeD (DUF308 family)